MRKAQTMELFNWITSPLNKKVVYFVKKYFWACFVKQLSFLLKVGGYLAKEQRVYTNVFSAAQYSGQSKFFLKIIIFKTAQKVTKYLGYFFQLNLLPRALKNHPIWSHCSQNNFNDSKLKSPTRERVFVASIESILKCSKDLSLNSPSTHG